MKDKLKEFNIEIDKIVYESNLEKLNNNKEYQEEVKKQLNYFKEKGFDKQVYDFWDKKFKLFTRYINHDWREQEEQIPQDILDILKNPNLFKEITEQELNKKIEGEVESRKVIFLCSAGGRLIKNSQLASYNLLVNDEAGVGKDYVTSKVLELIPEEYYIHKTRISPAVFTYWHNADKEPFWTWDGKVFYPEDISEAVLNSDVFKVMSSNGSSATIVVRQKAVDIEIIGKPVIITTTATAIPNPELTRRYVFLNLDSSEEQTKAIKKRHSKYAKAGLIPEYNEKYIEAQKYFKRVKVKIPFADLIDKHFPEKSVIMRTNYPRFLDFIKASAGFHQFQRKTDLQGFVLAEGQDYDIARDCFIKLSSNKYMIPLTINQKKILQVFEENPYLKGSASKLHAQQMNFISLPALQTNLGLMVKYGILETQNEVDSWNRDIEIYSLSKSYNPNEKIELPTFEELQNDLNSFNVLNDLNSLNTLNTSKKEQKEVGSKGSKGVKVESYIRHKDNLDFSELDEVFENG